MTKHYCDRCEKEVKVALKKLYTNFTNYGPLGNAREAIVIGDFCDDCMEKIKTFALSK